MLYCDATTHSGRTYRCLCHSDRRGANASEARRSNTALRHDPVDRHVPNSASTSSTAAPRTPLPPQHPRVRSNFGHRARRLRLRLWLCQGPYEGFSRWGLRRVQRCGRVHGRTGNAGGKRGHLAGGKEEVRRDEPIRERSRLQLDQQTLARRRTRARPRRLTGEPWKGGTLQAPGQRKA